MLQLAASGDLCTLHGTRPQRPCADHPRRGIQKDDPAEHDPAIGKAEELVTTKQAPQMMS